MSRCAKCSRTALAGGIYCNGHHVSELVRLRTKCMDLDTEFRQARLELWHFETAGVDWKVPGEVGGGDG